MKKVAIFLLMALCIFANAGERYGVINFSVSYLRLDPDYEAPLETQELMGTVVKILDRSSYWLKVECPQPYTAWCNDMGVVEMTEDEIKAYEAAPKYLFTSSFGRMYAEPSSSSAIISDLVMGDVIRMVKGKDKKKFVCAMLPDGREGYILKTDVKPADKTGKANGKSLVKTALEFVGTPYLWGGMCPKGFDCSGLTRFVYLMNGISIYRNAGQQLKQGVEVELGEKGSPDLWKNLQEGDLLFFGNAATADRKESVSHVGMYIGNGNFIHSSQVVRINSMDPSKEDCYGGIDRLLHARRFL